MPRAVKAIRIVGDGDSIFTTVTETALDLTTAVMLTDAGDSPSWLMVMARVDTTSAGQIGLMVVPGVSGTTPAALEDTGIYVGERSPALVDVRGFDTLWHRGVTGASNISNYAFVVEPIFE